MISNIEKFTKEPVSHYPKLGELMGRLDSLLDEYAGEIPTMAAIGVLEAKKHIMIMQQIGGSNETI